MANAGSRPVYLGNKTTEVSEFNRLLTSPTLQRSRESELTKNRSSKKDENADHSPFAATVKAAVLTYHRISLRSYLSIGR